MFPRVVLSTFLLCVVSANAETRYTLRNVDADRVEVSLSLEASSGTTRKLAARGTAWGLPSQIRSPRCGETALKEEPAGHWHVPVQCRMVTWLVDIKRVQDGTIDVSEQISIAPSRASWSLLSEPTAILRLQDDTNMSVLTTGDPLTLLLGATPAGERGWRLPSTNNAPEFFILGNASPTLQTYGNVSVRYVADDLARVKSLGLEAQHAQALKFLVDVLPPPAHLSSAERSLLVVWVGVEDRHGKAGGAAGSRSFLANYVMGIKPRARLNAARTLMIMAHEQFHQLADMTRGSLNPLPTWQNESLAHYYGLKALSAAHSGQEAKGLRGQFVNPRKPVRKGLLALQRRHDGGDASAYPLFYRQGATFWHEIDVALQKASKNSAGLDALIPHYLSLPIPQDGSLPKAFVDKLRSAAGPRIDDIIRKYVGN